MTPTGIILDVTSTDGSICSPVYEAYGWDKVNQIIQETLKIEGVFKVEIRDLNFQA